MKILGIDYGQKHIGLAIADEEVKIAHPYLVLENKSQNFILNELNKIIEREKVKKIVVGRPIGLSGQATEQTKITDEFIEFLKNNLDISIESFDERFTTKMATKYEFDTNKGEHSSAAAIILQDYLEKQKIKNQKQKIKKITE